MGSAASMAEWVLIPALCRPDSGALWAQLEVERPGYAYSKYEWDIRLLSGDSDWADQLKGVLIQPVLERSSDRQISITLAI